MAPAGASQPGVLDKLAGAVRDAAVSAAESLVSAGDPAAAANLQPGIPSSSGAEAASPEQLPAAQSDVSMARSSNGSEAQAEEAGDRTGSGEHAAVGAADPAIVGSQEWLAPQQQLPDQTPPEAGAAAAAATADGDATAQAASPAAAPPQQQQQEQQQQEEQQRQQSPQPPTDQQLDAVVAKLPEAQREAAKRKLRSSWDAKDARGGGGDFLFELGNTDYNTNVDVGESLEGWAP